MLWDMIFPNGRFKSLEVDRHVTLPSHMLAAHFYCIFAPCHFRGRVGVVSKYLRMSHFCTFIRFRTILVHICRARLKSGSKPQLISIYQPNNLICLGAHDMTNILGGGCYLMIILSDDQIMSQWYIFRIWRAVLSDDRSSLSPVTWDRGHERDTLRVHFQLLNLENLVSARRCPMF